MGKKRKTREEKIQAAARRAMQANVQSEFASSIFSFVKGEFDKTKISTNPQKLPVERYEKTDQTAGLASISHDLVKTLVLASVIFVAQAMLYFAWHV